MAECFTLKRHSMTFGMLKAHLKFHRKLSTDLKSRTAFFCGGSPGFFIIRRLNLNLGFAPNKKRKTKLLFQSSRPSQTSFSDEKRSARAQRFFLRTIHFREQLPVSDWYCPKRRTVTFWSSHSSNREDPFLFQKGPPDYAVISFLFLHSFYRRIIIPLPKYA